MSGDGEDFDDLLNSALDDFRHAESTATQASRPVADEGTSEASSSLEPRGRSSDSRDASELTQVLAEHETPGSASLTECVQPVGLGPGLGLPRRKAKAKQAERVSKSGTSTGFDGSSHRRPTNATEGVAKESPGQSPASKGDARLAAVEQLAAQTKETVTGIGAAGEGEGEGGGKGSAAEEEILDEEMMRQLMKQLEEMGTEDVGGVMDVVMKQLLSREVLEQPMRQLYDRYPSWLQSHAASLAPDELARYERQREAIRRLCQLYADRPEDFEAIFECMGEMQACGQPPPELIQEIAPGLELGADGLPVLPEFADGGLPKECSIM